MVKCQVYKKALMRNSTDVTEFRELLDGVKQQKKHLELPSEQLPERYIYLVGADGVPYRYHGGGYKVLARI
ncbi:MAG: hypothetical protein EOM40_13900 [Clostridia bacterium]|nr:hypothetical protein [Clostridia bacterium]